MFVIKWKLCLFILYPTITLAFLRSPPRKYQEVYVRFDPETVENLRTYEATNVTAHFYSNISDSLDLELGCDDPEVCDFVYSTQRVDPSSSLNLTVNGRFLGSTTMFLKVLHNKMVKLNFKPLRINVLRTVTDDLFTTIFMCIVGSVLIVNTFMMGTQLDMEVLKNCFKYPSSLSLIIFFVCQYFVMPMTSFIFANIFLVKYPMYQFAYFAVGCSPGGTNSNLWTIMLEGNIDLSVVMTFISTAAAMGMLPIYMYTLGRVFFKGEVEIPYLDIIKSLIFLLLPLIPGMLLAHFKPQLKESFLKVLRVAIIIFLVLIIVFGIYPNLYILNLFRWYTLVSGFLLPWCGYAISYFVSFMFGCSYKDCLTIMVETGVQNIPLSILIIEMSLPAPFNDLGQVMPISVILFSDIPLWLWFFILKCYQRIQKRKSYEQFG